MQIADQTEKKANDIHYAMSAEATKACSLLNDYRYELIDYRKNLDNMEMSIRCAELALELEDHCKEHPGIRSEIERAQEKMQKLIQQTKTKPCPEAKEFQMQIEETKRKIAVAEEEAAKTPAAASFFIVVGVICIIAAVACFIINKVIEPNLIVGMLGAWSVVGAIGSFILSAVATSPTDKAKERAVALKGTLNRLEQEIGRCDNARMSRALRRSDDYRAVLRVLGGARVLDLDI